MKKLLVVDDYEPTRILLGHVFKSSYTVVFAGDGDAAISQAESERPDVILMDLALPRRDGLDATRELKKRPSLAGIPVIALTAHDTGGEDERQALDAGCSAYLTKPFSPATLRQAVDHAVERTA